MPLASYLPDPDKWIRTTPASSSKSKLKNRPLAVFKYGLPTPPPSSSSGSRVRGTPVSTGSGLGTRLAAAPIEGGAEVSRLSFRRHYDYSQVVSGSRSGGIEKGKGKERATAPTPPMTDSTPRSRIQKIRDNILREYDTSSGSGSGSGSTSSSSNALRRGISTSAGSPIPLARGMAQSKLRLSTSPLERPLVDTSNAKPSRSRRSISPDKVRGDRRYGYGADSTKGRAKGKLGRSALGREASSSDMILARFKRSSDEADDDDQEDRDRTVGAGHAGVDRLPRREISAGKEGPSGPSERRPANTVARLPSRLHSITADRLDLERPAYLSEIPGRSAMEEQGYEDDGDVTETDDPPSAVPVPAHLDRPRTHDKAHTTAQTPKGAQRKATVRPSPINSTRGIDAEQPGYTPPDHSPILLTQPPRTVLKRYWSMNGSRVDGFGKGQEPWGKSKGYVDNERRRKSMRERDEEREREREEAWAYEQEQRFADGGVSAKARERMRVEVRGRRHRGEEMEPKGGKSGGGKEAEEEGEAEIRGMQEVPVRGLRKRDTGGFDLFLDPPSFCSLPDAEGGVDGYEGVISLKVPKRAGPPREAAAISAGTSPRKRRRLEPNAKEQDSTTPNKRVKSVVRAGPEKLGEDAQGQLRFALSPLRPNAASFKTVGGRTHDRSRPVSPSPRKASALFPSMTAALPVRAPIMAAADVCAAAHAPATTSFWHDDEFEPPLETSISVSALGQETDELPSTHVPPLSLFPFTLTCAPDSPRRRAPLSQGRPVPSGVNTPDRIAEAPRQGEKQHRLTPPKPKRTHLRGTHGRLSPPRAPVFTASSPVSSASAARSDISGSNGSSSSSSASSASRVNGLKKFKAVDVDETLMTWSLGGDGGGTAIGAQGRKRSADEADQVSRPVSAPVRPGARPLQHVPNAPGVQAGSIESGSGGSKRSIETQSLAPTAHSDSFPSLLPSQSAISLAEAQRQRPPRPRHTGNGSGSHTAAATPESARASRQTRWGSFSDLTGPVDPADPAGKDKEAAATAGARLGAIGDFFGRISTAASPSVGSKGSKRPRTDSALEAKKESAADAAALAAQASDSRKALRQSRSTLRKPGRTSIGAHDGLLGSAPSASSTPKQVKQTTLQAFGIVRERKSLPSAGERFEVDFEDEEDVSFEDEGEEVAAGADADVNAHRGKIAVEQTSPAGSSGDVRQARKGMAVGVGIGIMDAPPLHPGLRPAGIQAMREREAAAARRQAHGRSPARSDRQAPTSGAKSPSPSPLPEPVLFSPARQLAQRDRSNLTAHTRSPGRQGADAAIEHVVADSITSIGPTQHSPYTDNNGIYHSSSLSPMSFLNSEDDGEATTSTSSGLEADVDADDSMRGRVSKETREWWDRIGRE